MDAWYLLPGLGSRGGPPWGANRSASTDGERMQNGTSSRPSTRPLPALSRSLTLVKDSAGAGGNKGAGRERGSMRLRGYAACTTFRMDSASTTFPIEVSRSEMKSYWTTRAGHVDKASDGGRLPIREGEYAVLRPGSSRTGNCRHFAGLRLTRVGSCIPTDAATCVSRCWAGPASKQNGAGPGQYPINTTAP